MFDEETAEFDWFKCVEVLVLVDFVFVGVILPIQLGLGAFIQLLNYKVGNSIDE